LLIALTFNVAGRQAEVSQWKSGRKKRHQNTTAPLTLFITHWGQRIQRGISTKDFAHDWELKALLKTFQSAERRGEYKNADESAQSI